METSDTSLANQLGTVLRRGCYAVTVALAIGAAACDPMLGGEESDLSPDAGAVGAPSVDSGTSTTPTPTTITVTLRDRPNNPGAFSFLAVYQDGTGAWQHAPAPTGDTYMFPVSSQTWGFAWTCVTSTGARYVAFVYFSVAEKTNYLRSIPAYCTDRLPAPVTLSGTVSNAPMVTGSGMGASFGGTNTAVSTSTTTTTAPFAFTNSAPPGASDLVIHRTTTTATSHYASAVTIKRGVIAPATSTLVNWTTAGVTAKTISVTNATGTVFASTQLYPNAGSAPVSLSGGSAPATTATVTFPSNGLAATQAFPSDVYSQSVTVQASATASATVESWVTMVTAQSFEPPPPLGAVAISAPTKTPYPRVRAQWTPYANATGYGLLLTQASTATAPSTSWSGYLGAGYVGTTPDFQIPDLSALPGWSSLFAPRTGTAISGKFFAFVTSGGAADFPLRYPAPAGTKRTHALTSFTMTP